ncbi:MAG: hypothetical protein ACHQFX_01840 [Chitinophagales bacterium]
MKKLFVVLAVASLGFVACNNEASTEDAAKAKADSIRIADSIANAQKMEAMPTPAEIEAKRVADSTRVADSLKALPKK